MCIYIYIRRYNIFFFVLLFIMGSLGPKMTLFSTEQQNCRDFATRIVKRSSFRNAGRAARTDAFWFTGFRENTERISAVIFFVVLSRLTNPPPHPRHIFSVTQMTPETKGLAGRNSRETKYYYNNVRDNNNILDENDCGERFVTGRRVRFYTRLTTTAYIIVL